MKVYLPYHLGSGNRGCEGIARGISKTLNLKQEDFILFDISTEDYVLDSNFELDKVGELRYPKQHLVFEILRLLSRILQKINIPYAYNALMSEYYIHDAKPGDWIFITGGDIYCYKGAAKLPNLIVKKAKRKGIKTALFGVSLDKDLLSEEIVNGLKNYDLIITRESISYNTLNELHINNFLFPDPAFSLEPVKVELPEYFNKKVVGINFSPFTDTDPLFSKNMENLLKYLFEKGYEACLIPHVRWKGQDDRISMDRLLGKYSDCIHILSTDRLSYLQIRYVISKCSFFIGGRTHSVISAYCTGVPCLALGYSIKAIGIAKDIGVPEYTVLNSKNFKYDKQLVDSFKMMEKNRNAIMNIYSNIDQYRNRLLKLKDTICLNY